MCATSVIPPLRNERETEIKSEPIVQSPNIPQRGWPFTKFYRCTRAELAECSERGRSVGEQGVGVGHLFGCRWSSWKLLHRGTVGKRVARALVRWRTVGWEEESDPRRKQPFLPLPLFFFAKNEDRACSGVHVRGEGKKERKIKRLVPDAVQKLERERRRGRWKGVEA